MEESDDFDRDVKPPLLAGYSMEPVDDFAGVVGAMEAMGYPPAPCPVIQPAAVLPVVDYVRKSKNNVVTNLGLMFIGSPGSPAAGGSL